MKPRIILLLSLFAALSFKTPVKAQEAAYKWSFGANVGLEGYIGEYNASGVFSSPGFGAKISAAYLANVRWEFSANVAVSSVKGRVDLSSGQYPAVMKPSFSATVGELNFLAEFNFFPYGIGETYKRLKRWSPFLGVGLGIAAAKPKETSFSVAPELPLVFGIKYMPKERVNLRVELAWTKTFSHGIDGAANLYGVDRTWFKGTDWLMAFQVGISYTFGERCPTCQYID